MALIGRAFSAAPLYRMEHQHTSHPFLQRTNTPGIVDAPFLGASVSEPSQIISIPTGSGLNSNGSYYVHNQFTANPCPLGENGSLFLGGAAQSQNPAGVPALCQITCTGQPGRSRKHRLQEESDGCPLKKRRVSDTSTPLGLQESQASGVFAGGSGQPFWVSSHPQVKEAAVLPMVADPSSAMTHPVCTEEMEEVPVESQSDAVLRRIRDIESRLVVEDEEEEDDKNSTQHLPTLVMSDVLLEGFKKGLDESLTKKIVDSINRPSMELVLWKPQPEPLVNKLQSIASRYKTDKEVAKKIQRTPVTPLLQEVNPLGAEEPCNVDCDINTIWNREEEEMEL